MFNRKIFSYPIDEKWFPMIFTSPYLIAAFSDVSVDEQRKHSVEYGFMVKIDFYLNSNDLILTSCRIEGARESRKKFKIAHTSFSVWFVWMFLGIEMWYLAHDDGQVANDGTWDQVKNINERAWNDVNNARYRQFDLQMYHYNYWLAKVPDVARIDICPYTFVLILRA